MEPLLDLVAGWVATAIELVMVLVLVVGAIEALIDTIRQLLRRQKVRESIRETWLRFAAWIILALEFALAADLIRTIVSPTWDEVGMLAAIGAIRTLLSFFLGRDLEEFKHRDRREPGAA
ncbi:MAG TPA: DUF1622 domain-containing protein [Allosphingosinicella sp.]|nr:DUF1622 domain-containing protein [Allosphingosinicella sp.]